LEITDKSLKKRLLSIIKEIEHAGSLNEIRNIKPIKGYSGFYRIKSGDYRLGISFENDVVWLLFFGKRDESTYKKFP